MSGEKTPYTKCFCVLIAVPGGESAFPTCAAGMASTVEQENFLAISCFRAFPKLLGGKTPVADSEPEGCACTGAFITQR